MWQRAELVELDVLLAAVDGVEGDPGVAEEHVAMWFGDPRCRRKSEGALAASGRRSGRFPKCTSCRCRSRSTSTEGPNPLGAPDTGRGIG
jgi:hypothetical protein